MGRARIFPRETRGILTRTGGYLYAFTHTLQPYLGCQFSCEYCYVREMSVQRANPFDLPWSHWLAPKTNAPRLLAAQARRGVLARARIFCGSTTDPYTPLERELALTRGCLAVLTEHPPAALVVQTRSPFVTRDADLLARIPTVLASVTIATDDEAVRRAFEPNAPGTRLRLEALARLRAAGVRTQVAVSPLLPCDPERFAHLLDPVADRVVLDDFYRGDGARGRRSEAALAKLRRLGLGAWAEPGYADEALEVFRRVLGPERVKHSCAGFNDLSFLAWRAGAPGAAPDARGATA